MWLDNTLGNFEIFYVASYNNGQILSTALNISGTTIGISSFPQVTAIEDNVYVVWQDSITGNEEIFFKGSTDLNKINLSNTASISSNPPNCRYWK